MILNHRAVQPRALLVVGMVFLALANSWPRYIRLGAGLGADRVDAVRGALFGLAIGLNLWAVYLGSRRGWDG